MLTAFAYAVISYALPLACGLMVALLTTSGRSRWFHHVLWCAAAVGTSIVTQYAAFVVFAGVMTGNWPDSLPMGGLIYAIAWFAIVAIFTALPGTVAGYAIGAVLRSQRQAVTHQVR